MPTGKLKWFNTAKGFGFIVPDEGGPDVYLSGKTVESSRLPTLTPGITLRYEVTEARGKRTASGVAIVPQQKTIDPVDAFEEEWGLRPLR